MTEASLPTVNDIEAAAARIAPHAVRTPLLEFPILNEYVGARLFIKPENMQRTGSFKFRGAFNAVSQVDPSVRKNGIVAMSSGNHAQGIAEAARLFECPATIVMPRDAPATKLKRVQASGAKVVSYDRETQDRFAVARQVLDQVGGTFIHPFDHADVVAGQGTAGREIGIDLDALGITPTHYFCCTGGGGLLSGSSLALRAQYPDLNIVGVEPEKFDDWARSLEAGHPVVNEHGIGSVCDALLTPSPGDIPWRLMQQIGVRIETVSDDEALAAMRFAYDRFRLVVEPGGAVALALALRETFEANDHVVVMLSGGNVDDDVLLGR